MYLRQDVKGAGADLAEPAHDDTAAGRREVVPVAVKDGVLEEGERGLKAHLGKGTDVTLKPDAVEGRKAAVTRHEVADQVQVPGVHADAVTTEDATELLDDIVPRRLNAVHPQHGRDVVRLDAVGVDEVAVLLHRLEVDAVRVHHRPLHLLARVEIADRVIGHERAGADARYLLY